MIRPERPEDHAAIRALHDHAFAPSRLEADLVEALRTAGDHVPDLCLVAVDDTNQIVGHVMLSTARVGARKALALGPIAVRPDRQRRGIGTQLMHTTIRRARDTDYPLIALLGHPGFYAHFGFAPANQLHLTTVYDAPPEAWLALPLPAYDPSVRGAFHHPPAFSNPAH